MKLKTILVYCPAIDRDNKLKDLAIRNFMMAQYMLESNPNDIDSIEPGNIEINGIIELLANSDEAFAQFVHGFGDHIFCGPEYKVVVLLIGHLRCGQEIGRRRRRNFPKEVTIEGNHLKLAKRRLEEWYRLNLPDSKTPPVDCRFTSGIFHKTWARQVEYKVSSRDQMFIDYTSDFLRLLATPTVIG